MMKAHCKKLLWALLMVVGTVSVRGQEIETAVRFMPTADEASGDLCYHIQLRHLNGPAAGLGTQNYRIYYDASQVRFLRQRTQSTLDEASHGGARVIQAVHDSDASGFGNLEFSATLGFINLNINDTGKPEQLPPLPVDSWMATTLLCFEPLMPAPAPQLIWGRKGLTDGYATAFTRISVVGNDSQTTTSRLIYEDFITEQAGLTDKMAVTDIKE